MRYWWNPETQALEPYAERQAAQARDLVFNDAHYDGLKTTDGVDISTRKKHREYMKATGLATADDFKETWAKKQVEMEQRRAGTFHDPARSRELRETIGRTMYELRERKRRS
jgi:hypothetical protein